VNSAWIDHEDGMTFLSAQFSKSKESKSLWLFSKFCKVTELQMATASRFGDVPRREIAGHGALWKARKIPKRDNWWQKQPYLHPKPSAKEIILKKTVILTKFDKKVERNEIHADFCQCKF